MLARGSSIYITGLLLIALAWTPPAHAYIDGATASMIFQMLIAGGLAATFTMKMWWGKVKGFVTNLGRKPPSLDEKP